MLDLLKFLIKDDGKEDNIFFTVIDGKASSGKLLKVTPGAGVADLYAGDMSAALFPVRSA